MSDIPTPVSEGNPGTGSAKSLFGFRFVMLSRRWRKVIHAELAAAGLTDATWAPLVHLDEGGDGISQTELAERLALDTSTLVRLLDILSERGFIERRVDPKDRRARQIVLTGPGETEVARIKSHLSELEAGLLSGLSEAEVAAMLSGFEKISETVETRLEDRA
ncbi:MarR family winged helix-turn-helix transcriptional regulator [Celeribacter neptunius]|uniref:MarR family transcriptional regulator, transcriptional regulator for hemolysin n=1 Tax=Celeribacter neptunius TaxID=588602 RepID=A0A1I3P362_9RHOB|nr:MarR family winged helix-turn-helix transcriptional regulator [Celeribacter neptunius]SFJ15770.1 MarR family transcriptional regulator, transcriptional regulator for hemolysin [Celeribacter neptunius]